MKIPFPKLTRHQPYLLLSILLGAIFIFYNRYTMNSDGVNYCDISDALIRGDWRMAVNSFWSPLYPFLLSVALYIFKPSFCLEFPTIQSVNFLIYLLALWCFRRFYLALLFNSASHEKIAFGDDLNRFSAPTNRYNFLRGEKTTADSEETHAFPESIFIFLSYSLFLWTTLRVIKIQTVTPDLLIFAFFLLALEILLRVQTEGLNIPRSVFLGIVLGLGYLAKSIMFPLSLTILALLFLKTFTSRTKYSCLLITVLIFFLVGAPYSVPLSLQRGSLTSGETGKWHYAMLVHRINTLYYWQGEGRDNGTPQAPARRIFQNPNAYEFDRPGKMTNGLLFEPTYWTKGLKIHFNLKEIFHNLKFTISQYHGFFWGEQKRLILGLFLCLWLGRDIRRWFSRLRRSWLPLIPCLAGLGLYLMMYFQGRYLAMFILPLWLILFSGITFRRPSPTLKLLIFGFICFAVFPYWSGILEHGAMNAKRVAQQIHKKDNLWTNTHCEIARILKEKGFHPYDPIAFVGNSSTAYWVRLLRLKVIAEVPETDSPNFWGDSFQPQRDGQQAQKFWESGLDTQRQVLTALQQTGAKAVFTTRAQNTNGRRIGNTNYYILKE